MANRAYLLNTSMLTSDINVLQEKVQAPGNDYLEVAEASYRIPISWLRCFRPEDLRVVPVDINESDDDDEAEAGGTRPAIMQLRLPRTSVEQAIANLERSRPIFIKLGGEKHGPVYLKDAIDGLKCLPLPYLTMDVLEVVFGNDVEQYMDELVAALGDDARALECLMVLSFFEPGVLPFPLQMLNGVAGLPEDGRRANAVALDAGIYIAEYTTCHESPGSSLQSRLADLGKSVSSGDSLSKICDDVRDLFGQRRDNIFNSFHLCSVTQQPREGLKMLLTATNDAELATLMSDVALRNELEGSIHRRVLSACESCDIDYLGVAMGSREAIKRDFKDDWDAWSATAAVLPIGGAAPVVPVSAVAVPEQKPPLELPEVDRPPATKPWYKFW